MLTKLLLSDIMKKIFLLLVILTSASFSQNMRQNSYYSLFSDQKAAYVGDAITIIVVESMVCASICTM